MGRMARCWSCSACVPLLLVLLLPACKDGVPPAGDETSSTGGSTTDADPSTTSGMTTVVPTPTTTGVDPDSTTFGAGCGLDPCAEECGPDCEPTATCIASVWMCECDCPTTGTTGDTCSTLAEELDAWVDPSKTPALDCGDLGPADDATAWQTAHDCMLIQLAGSAVRATWTPPDGADPHQYGVGARVGVAYELAWFEASGTSTLVRHECTQIVATPDCTVDVGEMCLTCEGQTEAEILCEEPS